jgi:hypothetical protein
MKYKYYEVHRTQTCKAIGTRSEAGQGYQAWNKERKQFGTMAEAKKWLGDEYGNCKRVNMYRDRIDGTSEICGKRYCYNTPKCSYDDSPKHNQDWIEVREIKATTLKF